MMLAEGSGYPLFDVLWTMFVLFAWIMWFWLFIVIFADLFRRSDISGWGKAGWTVFVIVVPFIGVLTYLVVQGGNMAERRRAEAEAVQARFGSYIQSASSTGHASDQIAKAKDLLDSG